MYKPRTYQEEATQDAIDTVAPGKPTVIVLPTGSGKSIVIAMLTKQLEGKTLVIQPRKEILKQNHEKYTKMYQFEASIYAACLKTKVISDTTFSMIGSIKKIHNMFSDFSNIIIDECDWVKPEGSMFSNFLEHFKHANIIGLTATPIRNKTYRDIKSADKYASYTQANLITRTRPKIFKSICHVTQIQEMVKKKWWTPLEYLEIGVDLSELIVNSTGADYTLDSIMDLIKREEVVEKSIDVAKDLASQGSKKILIFAPNIEKSDYIAKQLNCQSVHSKNPTDHRDKAIEDFMTNPKTKYLVNVDILSFGFDFVDIDAVILARPTMSLRLFYQMVGRAVRLGNKDKAIIVDLVSLLDKFGKIEDLRLENDPHNGGWCFYSLDRLMTGTRLDQIKLRGDVRKDFDKKLFDRVVKKKNSSLNEIRKFGFKRTNKS